MRCCFTVFRFGGERSEEFTSGVCCFFGCFLCGGLCAQVRVWVAVHSSTLPDASSGRLGGWRYGDVRFQKIGGFWGVLLAAGPVKNIVIEINLGTAAVSEFKNAHLLNL